MDSDFTTRPRQNITSTYKSRKREKRPVVEIPAPSGDRSPASAKRKRNEEEHVEKEKSGEKPNAKKSGTTKNSSNVSTPTPFRRRSLHEVFQVPGSSRNGLDSTLPELEEEVVASTVDVSPDREKRKRKRAEEQEGHVQKPLPEVVENEAEEALSRASTGRKRKRQIVQDEDEERNTQKLPEDGVIQTLSKQDKQQQLRDGAEGEGATEEAEEALSRRSTGRTKRKRQIMQDEEEDMTLRHNMARETTSIPPAGSHPPFSQKKSAPPSTSRNKSISNLNVAKSEIETEEEIVVVMRRKSKSPMKGKGKETENRREHPVLEESALRVFSSTRNNPTKGKRREVPVDHGPPSRAPGPTRSVHAHRTASTTLFPTQSEKKSLPQSNEHSDSETVGRRSSHVVHNPKRSAERAKQSRRKRQIAQDDDDEQQTSLDEDTPASLPPRPSTPPLLVGLQNGRPPLSPARNLSAVFQDLMDLGEPSAQGEKEEGKAKVVERMKLKKSNTLLFSNPASPGKEPVSPASNGLLGHTASLPTNISPSPRLDIPPTLRREVSAPSATSSPNKLSRTPSRVLPAVPIPESRPAPTPLKKTYGKNRSFRIDPSAPAIREEDTSKER
ncbi:hypothetical protein BT69DRAFT_352787 [Atractiella rhizophila]|nr:hypothetical protein BT69DRAFT_352787 [Atractiella rhizophila]